MDTKKEIRTLFIVVTIVFVVSLFYSFYYNKPLNVDSRAYDRIAWNLVQGNGYREIIGESFLVDRAIVRVGPGYEFFLSGIYYIFGHRYGAALVANAILMALSALFIFLTAKEVFKKSWSVLLGIVSAVLIGFSPDLITINGMIMTENLGIFLLIVSVFAFFKYVNSENKPFYLVILLSLFLGCSALTRTPLILLVLPFVVYFVMNKKWKHLLLFCFVLMLVLTPWVIRNWQIYHLFIPTNMDLGYALISGNHPGATGELEPYIVLEKYLREYGNFEATKLARDEAISFILHNPFEFLKITFYRTSIYFSSARPTGFWGHLQGLDRILTLIMSAIYSFFLFGFGFWGIYRARKKANPEDKTRAKFLFWMLVLMPLAIIGIIVETRYRFLVYPFFAIFAGYGFVDLIKEKKDFRALFIIFGILFLNSGFDALRNFGKIIERISEFF